MRKDGNDSRLLLLEKSLVSVIMFGLWKGDRDWSERLNLPSVQHNITPCL